MNAIKHSLLFLACFVFSALLAGCGGGGGGGNEASADNPVSLTDVSISPGSVTLAINSSQTLSAAGIYSDNTSRTLDGQVAWSSTNEATASVSDSGVVTANSAGGTEVVATSGSISKSIPVTVSPATLQSISVSSAVSQVPAGLSTRFLASGLYSDGTQQNLTDQVVWSVSDQTRASIDVSTGLLTGQQAGSITVTATKEGLSGSLSFTVSPATLQSLQSTPATLALAKGTSQRVTVTGLFSDNSNQNVSDQISWSSSAESIATVSDDSLVTALLEGSATLTASLAGTQVDLPVTVTSAELAFLSLTPVNKTLPLGRSQQYVAQGTYSDGSVQDLSAAVTWFSSNQDAAVIGNSDTAKGRADSLSPGSTTVSAVLGACRRARP
ncbi:Ig-like domain-containing protein [Marinobacter halotolerans]|uniref:Ig-like domain-containing protein n=1 Tax=Marinobacter halotolerans TaxID=1569211 RepID=UPI0012459AF9|nr:Ig-like domain-containing protein [Marinobacter halotolerans]